MQRSIRVLVGAIMVAGAIGLVAPGTASASPSHVSNPCVKVRASIDPHHPDVGDFLSFGADFWGCGRSVFIRWRVTVSGPDARGYHGHARISRHVAFGLGFGVWAQKGTYRITAEAFHDGRVVDRMSRRVHVRP